MSMSAGCELPTSVNVNAETLLHSANAFLSCHQVSTSSIVRGLFVILQKHANETPFVFTTNLLVMYRSVEAKLRVMDCHRLNRVITLHLVSRHEPSQLLNFVKHYHHLDSFDKSGISAMRFELYAYIETQFTAKHSQREKTFVQLLNRPTCAFFPSSYNYLGSNILTRADQTRPDQNR